MAEEFQIPEPKFVPKSPQQHYIRSAGYRRAARNMDCVEALIAPEQFPPRDKLVASPSYLMEGTPSSADVKRNISTSKTYTNFVHSSDVKRTLSRNGNFANLVGFVEHLTKHISKTSQISRQFLKKPLLIWSTVDCRASY